MYNYVIEILFKKSSFFSYKEQQAYQINEEIRNERKLHQGVYTY